MNGKISVQATISKGFGGDFEVKLRALVVDKRSANTFGKGYGKLCVKPKHEIKFDTLQFICDVHDKYENLDESNNILLDNLPATFVKGKRKDSSEYYCVIVKLENDEIPLLRTFYLTSMQVFTLKKQIKPEYEFTESDLNEEQLDSNDSVEDEE